jgi:molybdopterin/thiamine biosynthesis adenylyltransferase
MNFSKKRPVKIVMLGAGGTGAHIAPHLYRLLYALERPVKFIICDGDKVEPKNLVRQNFTEADLGENKARVRVSRKPHKTVSAYGQAPFRPFLSGISDPECGEKMWACPE